MFYLLTVYSTGATLMIQGDDLKALNLMGERQLGNDGVTYVQIGALPIGPVFTSQVAEPTMFPVGGPESPIVKVEPDTMTIELPTGVYWSPSRQAFGSADHNGLHDVFRYEGSPDELAVWNLHKHLFPIWPMDQQGTFKEVFDTIQRSKSQL